MSKFENVEEIKKYIEKLENNLKQFEDQAYNINQDILKAKEEINSMSLLETDLKRNNYEKWCECSIEEKQVEEVTSNEPTIDDIIGGIDIN